MARCVRTRDLNESDFVGKFAGSMAELVLMGNKVFAPTSAVPFSIRRTAQNVTRQSLPVTVD